MWIKHNEEEEESPSLKSETLTIFVADIQIDVYRSYAQDELSK